jgi:hypothetical protein
VVSYAKEAVEARLIELARESRARPSPVRLEMSAQAVTSRLEMLGALSALCASLAGARRADLTAAR